MTGPRADQSLLTVTAWNVEAGGSGGQRLIDGLTDVTSDLIALEELQPAMADAATTDPSLAARYPYSTLHPDKSVLGVGLLSRLPIIESSANEVTCPTGRSSCTAPPMLRAVIQLPDGRTAVVFVVHPLPGHFQTIAHVPFGIDTQERDAALASIRTTIDGDLEAGRTVIVMGDINTTDRERAYGEFSAGLHDARRAGPWPGLTWRPDMLNGLPFGLLRIDYVFSSLVPTDYSVRCTNLSDHCLISASLASLAP
jgi:endonuclease/exonuclease/phosphatase (EEP) superfamily protein YafD